MEEEGMRRCPLVRLAITLGRVVIGVEPVVKRNHPRPGSLDGRSVVELPQTASNNEEYG
jgi:hypothetical protein